MIFRLSLTAAANNQLQGGYVYDAAGNMTHDATANLNYTFDQENRITAANGYTYTYDGDGNRVRKSNGNAAGNGTLSWYMTPGVVAETDLAGTAQSEYVFFDGERVARRDGVNGAGGVFYYFSDHLKTASVITDSAGVIKAESDYYPWGGELQFVNNDSNDYKFTGKKRDNEDGLDYFGARYYSNGLGRFMTPDDFLKDSDVSDPQSWNKYAYARNNPLRYTDPTGEEATVTTSCDKNVKTCQVNVSASIAIYSVNGTTDKQLATAQAEIKNQIEAAWSGSFQQDGTTYNVSTSVSVSVVQNEDAGIKSGAQNVIGIDSSGKTENSHVDEGGRNGSGQRYDKGIFDFSQVMSGMTVPHEFSHFLGLDDNSGKVLSNNKCEDAGMCLHPKATAQDFSWAFGPEIKSGRAQFNVGQYGGRAGGINARGNRRWWQGLLDRR